MAKAEKDEETKEGVKPPIPRKKKHKLLKAIDSRLKGAHVIDEVTVLGVRYKMRTLDPSEETWADSYVAGENFYQTARARRAPYVAASLLAIWDDERAEVNEDGDGWVPVTELFAASTDELEPYQQTLLENEVFHANWTRTEVLAWLTDEDKHGPFVQQLFSFYIELENRRNEALENLDPLSKSHRTGG